MMNNKYKVTPFARLLLFLVLFAPIAYLSASYLQGENGIQNLKDAIGLNTKTTGQKITKKEAKIQKLETEISKLKAEIEILRKE